MILYKGIYHIFAIIRIIIYKIVYGNQIKVGKGTTFRRQFSLMIGKNGKVIIGENCFLNNRCSINALDEIRIGHGTILGEDVKIYDHNHKFNQTNKPIKEQGYSIGKVQVGNNCWIGSNVIILKDTIIGDNCVIGAGSIVSGKIDSFTIVKPTRNYHEEKISIHNL